MTEETQEIEQLEETQEETTPAPAPQTRIRYDANNHLHVILLLQWYNEMLQSGELSTTFSNSLTSFAQLLDKFKGCDLLLNVDESGIYAAVWVQPWLGGAVLGLWSRADRRNSKSAFDLFISTANEVFHTCDVIIGVTCRADILEEHRKLGYSISGEIPHLYGRDISGWVVNLQKKNFKYLKEDSDG